MDFLQYLMFSGFFVVIAIVFGIVTYLMVFGPLLHGIFLPIFKKIMKLKPKKKLPSAKQT